MVNHCQLLSSFVLVGFLLGMIFKNELPEISLICVSFLSGWPKARTYFFKKL
jgi:hypothetical protein